MQSQTTDRSTPEFSDHLLGAMSGLIDLSDPQAEEFALNPSEPVQFQGQYTGQMEMYADAGTVAHYLDNHPEWFRRCAHPMKAELIGRNGYALIIGRFAALDFEVEPKIGLHLLPQEQSVYRIETIPVPGYTPQGYTVDFRAAMTLVEVPGSDTPVTPITQVEWTLHLTTWVHLPRFLHALPKTLVKGSGDRLLNEIVRQVSRRLTRKVQADFHSTHNLPSPIAHRKRYLWSRFTDGSGTQHQSGADE